MKPNIALKHAFHLYGVVLVRQPKRLKALLHDLCPHTPPNRRDINILLLVLKAGVPNELLAMTVGIDAIQARVLRRIDQAFGLDEALALQAVQSWAVALNVVLPVVAPKPAPVVVAPVAPPVVAPKPQPVAVPQPAPVRKPSPINQKPKAQVQASIHWTKHFMNWAKNNIVASILLFIMFTLIFFSTVYSCYLEYQKILITIENNQARTQAQFNQGIWTDPKTGMMWMRCSIGQKWTGTTCQGEASRYEWQDAKNAVASMNQNGGYAGYTDWVVPHIQDLMGLIRCDTGFSSTYTIPAKNGGEVTVPDECKEGSSRPTINQSIFPNTPSSWFWSSSPNNVSHAWDVYFAFGKSFNVNKDGDGHVRVVRGSQ